MPLNRSSQVGRPSARVLPRPSALAGPPRGEFGVGGGQGGAVVIVTVLGNPVADVREEVFGAVEAESLGHAAVRLPHALGDAQVDEGGVVRQLCSLR